MARISRIRLNNKFTELSIELTHKCSLNCVYCSSSGGINQEIYIDFERIKEIILEVKNEFNVKTISLSGGESFLYPEFWNLFDFITNNELDILIYTSGVLLDDNGKRVPISTDFLQKMKDQQKGLKIIMNIHGHNKNLTEKLNRIKGSYEIIGKSIDRIVSEDIYLGGHIVSFKYNFKFLNKIFEFCKLKSFNDVSFLRFVPQGRGSERDFYNTKLEFAEIIQSIIKILVNQKNKESNLRVRIGHPINFLFLTGNGHLYDEEETHYCRGGIDAPLILPDGQVSMCPAWKDLSKFSAGNIYEKNFNEIWNSEYFKIFRKFIEKNYQKIKDPCKSCVYLNECRGKCVAQRLLDQNITDDSSLEDLIYHAPDPQCFKEIV